MNTRTYYRNSVLAFPKTAEYANPITRHKPRLNADSVVMYVCAFAVVFVALLLVLEAV